MAASAIQYGIGAKYSILVKRSEAQFIVPDWGKGGIKLTMA